MRHFQIVVVFIIYGIKVVLTPHPFNKEPLVPVLESLISINNKLGQTEAAAGLLEWGQNNLQGDLKEGRQLHFVVRF